MLMAVFSAPIDTIACLERRKYATAVNEVVAQAGIEVWCESAYFQVVAEMHEYRHTVKASVRQGVVGCHAAPEEDVGIELIAVRCGESGVKLRLFGRFVDGNHNFGEGVEFGEAAIAPFGLAGERRHGKCGQA